jgi:nucleoside-diphosphate-sugar epimerase
MKICVGGGCGYVGSALVPSLLDHGYDVTVIDLCWFGNHLPKEVCVTKKDLFECTEKDFEGCDQFIYLGGISNDPSAEYDSTRNFIYNAALPAQLALLAKRAGVKRFIYAGSCSVYGYTINELYDETAKISCNYPYGVSKYQGECGVLHLQDANFSVIAFRKGTISGVSPRMRFDLIVNTMTKSAITEGKITITNAALWRPILDIRDAVSAYLRAIQADYSINGVFNIAHDNYTVGAVADIVKTTVESFYSKRVKLDIKNIADLRNYKVKTEKARMQLGFHPRYNVEAITIDILKNWGRYEDAITNDNYYNIKICQKIFKEKISL